MKWSIKRKLLLGFLSITLFFGVTSGVFYHYNNKVNVAYLETINLHVKIALNAKDMQVLAQKQTSSLRGYLLTKNIDFLIDLQAANADMQDTILQTAKLVNQVENKKLVKELEILNIEFKKRYDRLLTLHLNNNDQTAAIDLFKSNVLPIGIQLAPLTETLSDRQFQLMNKAVEDNSNLVQDANELTLLIMFIAIIVNTFIGLATSNHITRNLKIITHGINKITSKTTISDELLPIEIRSNDEIEEIASAFNRMTMTIKEKSWLETNVTKMATTVQGIHHVQKLAEHIITKLTPILDAHYGIFYSVQQAGIHTELYKIASYAYSGTTFPLERDPIKVGEGLVGQAVYENRKIHITEVPKNYIQISSGIGSSVPTEILIMPIEYEGEVIAAIELASLKQFQPIHIALLEQTLIHIGITLNSVIGRMKIENLLQNSKTLTEELQTQSEELQYQQEELVAINEQLSQQFKKSEQRSRELHQIKLELEEKAIQLKLNTNYKSQFLANMSHELRSPLTSLLILAQILVENKDGNLTDNQVVFAETIHQSGNDLLHLINEILDLAKIESGKMDIHPHPVKIIDIFSAVERQFRPIALQKQVEFTINIDSNLPLIIITDQGRLQQILNNLLSNAFKFTKQGSVSLYGEQRDGSVVFSVKDTGIGIPDDQVNLLFEAFHQGDGTTNRKYGGTGLGLSISREIASLLNGDIEVRSIQGIGSTFSVSIPIQNWQDTEEATKKIEFSSSTLTKRSAIPILDNKKVLIIDDDLRNIFALTTALEEQNMSVIFAENGKQGIETLLLNEDIELILMDIMMPEMDGYETTRLIRQKPEFKDIPIIALTAKAMKNDREKCLASGATTYISKPVNTEELYTTIVSTLKLFR